MQVKDRKLAFSHPLIITLLYFFFPLSVPTQVQAKPNTNVKNTFQWKFAGDFVSPLLPECQEFPIIVESSPVNQSSIGTPPYYFMAFELGGVPTVDFAGTDPNNLTWRVNHKAGSRLMLTMADADGNAGGTPNIIFNVTAAGDSSCLPPSPTSDFSVTANVTSTLNTCEPWGLTMQGGVEPYTITLVQTTSMLNTNVTLSMQEDVLTFIDRADPNQFLMAAVSDATGKFGKATSAVRTQGPIVDSQSCGALVTTAGNSTSMQATLKDNAEIAQTKHQQMVTVIAVTTVAVIVVIVCLVSLYLYLRRRRRRFSADTEGMAPRAFERIPSPITSLPSQLLPFQGKSSTRLDTATESPSGPSPLMDSFFGEPMIQAPSSLHTFPAGVATNSTSPRPHRDAPQLNPAWIHKLEQARVRRAATAPFPVSPVPRQAIPRRAASASVSRWSDASNSADGDSTVVFQHRDGGRPGRVRELPPPYPNSLQ